MNAEKLPDVENLSADQCWSLLRSAGVARLAVWVEDRPEIFPINYVVDGGTLVFRSAPGTKVASALGDALVSLEADGVTAPEGLAWSVMASGQARLIEELEEVVDSFSLPLFPWQAGRKNIFVRVVPDRITGRRFAVADPAYWRNPLSDIHRSAQE